ncbi:hypothetical protein ACWGQL_37225 [Streptomyces lydicus]
MLSQPCPELTEEEVHCLVQQWLHTWNEHLDSEHALEHITTKGFTLHLPERVVRGREEFLSWYQERTRHYARERISVLDLQIRCLSPVHAAVTFTLDWKAELATPAEDEEPTLHLQMQQEWSVVRELGAPRVRFCSVMRPVANPNQDPGAEPLALAA